MNAISYYPKDIYKNVKLCVPPSKQDVSFGLKVESMAKQVKDKTIELWKFTNVIRNDAIVSVPRKYFAPVCNIENGDEFIKELILRVGGYRYNVDSHLKGRTYLANCLYHLDRLDFLPGPNVESKEEIKEKILHAATLAFLFNEELYGCQKFRDAVEKFNTAKLNRYLLHSRM